MILITIKQKRGLEKNLPTLEEGQLALTTDQKNIYMGSDTGNLKIAKDSELQLVAESSLRAIQHINLLTEAITGIRGDLSAVTIPATAELRHSGGADYAEFFEWADNNPEGEDRVGFAVTLEGRKIRKATSNDELVLGVISSNPSVVGDASEDNWKDKYVTDEWERIQYESEADKRTAKLNPEWNPDQVYVPREKRKEWSPVGLVGKLLVKDDGTSIVNKFVKVGAIDGEVTASNEPTNMIVLERVSENIIRVLIK